MDVVVHAVKQLEDNPWSPHSKSLRGILEEKVSPDVLDILVFETAGRIQLQADLTITTDNIVIAGESAPWPGIFITDYTFEIQDAKNVHLRHLNIWGLNHRHDRDGPQLQDFDTLRLQAKDPAKPMTGIEVYRCFIGFGTDETVSNWHFQDARTDLHSTLWIENIIAYGLNRAGHPEGDHSKGMIIGEGTGQNTVLRNLFAYNNDRNPIVGAAPTLVANNIILGSSRRAISSGDGVITTSIQNNVMLGYRDSLMLENQFKSIFAATNTPKPGSQIHIDGWFGWHGLDHPDDVYFKGTNDQYRVPSPPAGVPTATVFPTTDVVSMVLPVIGPRHRHPIADALVAEAQGLWDGTGQQKLFRIDHESEAGVDWNEIPSVEAERTIGHEVPVDLDETNWRDWLDQLAQGDIAQDTPN